MNQPDPTEAAKHVARAIFALKTPSPDGSQHYQSGWDDGLEAAMDAARDAVLAVLPAPAPLPGPTTDRRDRYAAAIEQDADRPRDERRGIIDAVLAVADAEQTAALSRAVAAILTDAGLRAAEGEPALAAYGRELARLIQPDGQPACPDPIECSHEAALGEAQQEVRRLGLTVSEYGQGASALTDKLRRARTMHRETCPLATGKAGAGFSCSMCELLDAPAAPVVPPAPTSRAALLREAEWTECSPEWLAVNPGQCGTAPRVCGDAGTSHWHPRRLAAVPAAEEQRGLTVDDFARMQAGADVIAGRARLPFNQLPADAQERHRDAARTLLARAAAAQPAPLCAHCGDPIANPTAWISLWTDGQERRYHMSTARPECQPAAEQPDNETPDETVQLAKVVRWVTAEVVSAKTEFGDGYRAAQRDIRDLVKGRFDNDPKPAVVPQPEEA